MGNGAGIRPRSSSGGNGCGWRLPGGSPAATRSGEIARDLRVTEGSVRRWHRAWRDGGTEALRSKGPVSRERLSPQQWARLEAELRKGPLAHGFR
jgi:putative transposase